MRGSYGEKIDYMIAQLEEGERGTRHFQGYIEFSCQMRLTTVKNIIPAAHWERRKGNRDQARDYCKKDESRIRGPWEVGSWQTNMQAPKKSKHEEFTKAIKEGKGDLELLEQYPALFLRYHKAVDKIRSLKIPQRDWKTTVSVILGPTGTGKSRYAHEKYPDAFWKTADQWWDNYEGEETVIFDEFDGSWFPFTQLLRILDRYKLKVPVKGGFVSFAAKKIVIISNHGISKWYSGDRLRPKIEALHRRIDIYKLFLAEDDHRSFEDKGTFELIANQYDLV